MTAEELIRLLDLKPLPQEGGYYRETYRAPLSISQTGLPECYEGDRNASTAIYFLLTPEENSALHILPTDELFHFYCGDPVEMLLLPANGPAEEITLGIDFAAGQRPQVVAPGNVWQGAQLAEGGRFALLGCTVAPGFDFRDFRVASPADMQRLLQEHPTHSDKIRRLAPPHPAGPTE